VPALLLNCPVFGAENSTTPPIWHCPEQPPVSAHLPVPPIPMLPGMLPVMFELLKFTALPPGIFTHDHTVDSQAGRTLPGRLTQVAPFNREEARTSGVVRRADEIRGARDSRLTGVRAIRILAFARLALAVPGADTMDRRNCLEPRHSHPADSYATTR
jgi:hypothetical protein